METYDVIIIGAGFAGASTAYHLARRGGAKVLLLEREYSFGVHSSGKNAALLRQAVAVPGVAPLIQETLKTLLDPPRDWERRDLFRQTGSLIFGDREKLSNLQNMLHELSAEAHLYRPGELPEKIPDRLKGLLKEAAANFLLHTPADGVVDIHALLGNLLQSAKGSGVEIRYQSEVVGLEFQEGFWMLRDRREKYLTRAVVNAAGAWAAGLGEGLGMATHGMKPYRRHLFISGPISYVETHWPFCWDIDAEYYFRPESGGLLLTSGDEEAHPPIPPHEDTRMLEILAQKLRENIPPLSQLDIAKSWACLRTKRKDGQFQLGMDPKIPGFFWVAALGGHGMSASMGVGRVAARQIFDYLETGTSHEGIFRMG